MHFVIILSIFFTSIYQTMRRGPGGTFVYVFVPVLLLLGVVRPIALTLLPDMTSIMAVSYGTVLGMIFSGRMPGLRLHPVDAIVATLSLTIVITGVVNGEFWTLVSATGNESLKWLVPYYMARVAFRDPALRLRLTLTLCWIAIAMGAMGLIEFRLWPLFFSRTFESLGLSTALNETVQKRWAFFRAMVTCEHPIDFGNVGMILAGLIPAMAVTCGLRLTDKRVMFAILASAMIVVEAISFSTFIGAGVAIGLYLMLRYIRFSEYLLVPGMIAAALGGFMFTASLLDVDLEAIRPPEGEAALAGSYFVRVLIVQNSWNSYGNKAGLLGFGDNSITKETLGLDSVDNSYMLFLMRRGWLHLLLRIALGVTIGLLGTLMLRRSRGKNRIPPAACVAVLLGTMASMYTVWFGFVYSILWTLTLAMTVTMRQMIAGTVKQEVRATPSLQPFATAGRGFDVLPSRNVPQPARMA